jgi:hypothetical protein
MDRPGLSSVSARMSATTSSRGRGRRCFAARRQPRPTPCPHPRLRVSVDTTASTGGEYRPVAGLLPCTRDGPRQILGPLIWAPCDFATSDGVPRLGSGTRGGARRPGISRPDPRPAGRCPLGRGTARRRAGGGDHGAPVGGGQRILRARRGCVGCTGRCGTGGRLGHLGHRASPPGGRALRRARRRRRVQSRRDPPPDREWAGWRRSQDAVAVNARCSIASKMSASVSCCPGAVDLGRYVAASAKSTRRDTGRPQRHDPSFRPLAKQFGVRRRSRAHVRVFGHAPEPHYGRARRANSSLDCLHGRQRLCIQRTQSKERVGQHGAGRLHRRRQVVE